MEASNKQFGINFINFCQSCKFDQIDLTDFKCEEIEFYCRSCDKSVCRNCLLKYHLNLDIVPNSKKKQQIQEKQELLNQYERKTFVQRMSVSLTEELKIDQTGPMARNHEIMDIKKEFSNLNMTYNSIIENLSKMSAIQIQENHSLNYNNLIAKYIPEINGLLEKLQFESLTETAEKLNKILNVLKNDLIQAQEKFEHNNQVQSRKFAKDLIFKRSVSWSDLQKWESIQHRQKFLESNLNIKYVDSSMVRIKNEQGVMASCLEISQVIQKKKTNINQKIFTQKIEKQGIKKQISCPDFVDNLMMKNQESETIINDIMDNNDFKPEIIATAEDFSEIENLIEMDDIEFETNEQFLMEQIYDFIDRTELTAEQVIMGQICQEQPLYVIISKQFFLQDVKDFLYDFVTTGQFYQSQPKSPEQNKMTVLKIIHKFKKQVESMLSEQKDLKTKTVTEIQTRQAIQRQTQTQIKSDFSRQTIESSPQLNFHGTQKSSDIKIQPPQLNIKLNPVSPAAPDRCSNMLVSDRETLVAIESRLSKQPRNSEFVVAKDISKEEDIVPDKISAREKDIQLLDIEIQKGKVLIKHLLRVFKKTFQASDIVQPETEKQRLIREQQEKNEISIAQYIDILFNMIISKKEFGNIENMNDFVQLVDFKFKSIIDIHETAMIEILFIEKIDNEQNFIIHSKDKFGMDLDGKELLIFMIENEQAMKKEIEVQTESMPIFTYKFDLKNVKRMPEDCKICKQQILITDEYIRLLDCNHIYHRICLIHYIAELTSKRFFLTRVEQKRNKDQPLCLCPNCKNQDQEFGYLSQKFCKGYRKHVIFDLLKDKADLFYSKMLERKIEEENQYQENQDDSDPLSQDSENYNQDYQIMAKNNPKLDQDIAQNSDDQDQMSFDHDASKNEVIYQEQETLDPEQHDDLAASIRDSINKDVRQSEKEELESVYSELDQSMQQHKARSSQLIAVPNSLCSVCNIEKESCIILTNQCRHQACIDCIEGKITLPIQEKLENRQKISVDHVMCKAAEWCENIMPCQILLPLLNLSQLEHSEDIERIKDMYEQSVCCMGDGNIQFVDQIKWMAHCMVCQGKYCVVCVGADSGLNLDRKSQRLTLAQCQCVRCPQCDSANTVNRDQTKSYYCHICTKNFCWSCHQSISECQCFSQKNEKIEKSKKGKKRNKEMITSENILEIREQNIQAYNQRIKNENNHNQNGKYRQDSFDQESDSDDVPEQIVPPPKKKKNDEIVRSKSQGRSKSKNKHRANLSDEEESEKPSKKESVGFLGGFFGSVFGRPKRDGSKNPEKSPRGHSLESNPKPKRNRSNSSQKSEFKSGQMLEKKHKKSKK